MINDIKTILFDFDGVVVDSEPAHARSKKIVLEKFNIPYSPIIFEDFKGKTDQVFFDFIAEHLDPERRLPDVFLKAKNDSFEELITEIDLIDGFLTFHKKAKTKGIQTALVSSTTLYSFQRIDRIYHLSDLFDLVITGADTKMHKPHPEPYLKAYQLLNLDHKNTIVIEDSPNGICSAKKAGCFVFGITNSFSGEILREAGADEIVGSYKELEIGIGL